MSTTLPRLFIKPGCPWCTDAIAWLNARKFGYQLVDVLSSPSAYNEMKQLSGQNLTPTMVWPDGGVLADFDTGQLAAFLDQNGISS